GTSFENRRSHHQAPPQGLHGSGVLQHLRPRRQAANTVRGRRMSALARITEELLKLQRAGIIEAFYADDYARERTWTIQISASETRVWTSGEVEAFVEGIRL